MLSTRIRRQIIPTRNELQKINMRRARTSQLACSRLSDSGEDAKVQGARKWWRAGKKGKGRKGETAPPPPPLSSFLPSFFLFALSQFRGPDYLGAWNTLPLSMKQEAKIMRICSVIIYPLEKKFILTSSLLGGGKSRVLPADPLFTHWIMPGTNWNSSDFPSRSSSRSAGPPICLSLQCPLLVTQLFPPLPRMFQ